MCEFDGVPLRIAAGCATPRAAETDPDVMRGEETQVFGATKLLPSLADGRHQVILPGTHSKWVVLESGAIETFRTVPTSEIYTLLQQSSMRGASGSGDPAELSRGFDEGLDRSRDGVAILSGLFVARAAQLRDNRSGDWSTGFLSGLLIGSEIAENLQHERPSRLSIIGDAHLVTRYRLALAKFGVASDALDAGDCTRAGLELLA